jgi:hypothetical protein
VVAACDRELQIRCVNTGTYFKLALTEAQHGTFVDGEAGMEPATLQTRVFDVSPTSGTSGLKCARRSTRSTGPPAKAPQAKRPPSDGLDGRSWTRTRDLFLIREAL